MPSDEMAATLALMWAQRAEGVGRADPSLDEMRARLDELGNLFPVPADVTVTQTNAGGVPACWLDAPGVDHSRVLMYLHGGGYVGGSARSHGELAARLARATGARALVLDYRLAPAHPIPGALEDAVTAWRWLLHQGVAPGSAVLAGDSAGGGLAAATMVALREAGDPLPAAAALLSPWTDLTGSGPSMATKAGVDPVLTAARQAAMARDYAGDADLADPRLSPLFADLTGLPPLLVHAGSAELLLDDGRRLAEAAGRAGVAVSFEEAADMPHVWHIIAVAPEATAATGRIGAFLAGQLA